MSKTNGYATEGEFTSAVLKAMKQLPRIEVYRVNRGRRAGVSFGGLKGAADIQGVVGENGRMFGCELKQPGKELEPDQVDWATRMRARGVLVWSATTMEEAIGPLLEELKRSG